jgi:SAM-dependent methyltransferase
MKIQRSNRFQDFFEEDRYVLLKNYLYNYLLRRRAVQRELAQETHGIILEVGSGISPIIMDRDKVAYTELSPLALQILRRHHGRGWYVVADAMHLPFKPGVFSHVVCSEVLEHLRDDRTAIREMARVLKAAGRVIMTFPHRRAYFALDDRFVEHYRRYDLKEMIAQLEEAGLQVASIQKVLGPLEKVTMILTITFISLMQRYKKGSIRPPRASSIPFLEIVFKWANRFYGCLAWCDARIVPRSLATVLLVHAIKN